MLPEKALASAEVCNYVGFVQRCTYGPIVLVYLLIGWYSKSTLPWGGSWQTISFTCKISRTPFPDPCKPSGSSGHVPTVNGQLLARGRLVTYRLRGNAPTAYRHILVHRSLVHVWLLRCSLTVCICLLSSILCLLRVHIALLCMLVPFPPLRFRYGADTCAFAYTVRFCFRPCVCAL